MELPSDAVRHSVGGVSVYHFPFGHEDLGPAANSESTVLECSKASMRDLTAV